MMNPIVPSLFASPRTASPHMASLRLVAAATILLAATSPAQETPAPLYDRTELLGSQAGSTSDTVQRIPMPSADYNAPAGSFVLVGGRLFDGTGTPARPATVVVTGKRITAILKPGATDWPKDARVYDVSGKTILPGLIDLHTHLTYPGDRSAAGPDSQGKAMMRGLERMRIYAESGITSVRDLASQGTVPFELKAEQSRGRIAGPRIFPAGQLITAIGGHGAGSEGENALALAVEASGPDAFRAQVRRQFKRGADVIKLGSHYSQAEIDAAVDEAHKLGLPVTVDAESDYIRMAIQAGVDSIEHPLPRTDADIAEMAKKGIASVPTMVPYWMRLSEIGGYFGNSSRRFELTQTSIDTMLRKLRAARIKIGVGTDLVGDKSERMPAPYIEELNQLTKVGFSRTEALVAATRTSAEILRMADRLGTVQPGKLADILVVDGNPDEDLHALSKVVLVFVNGRLTVANGQLQLPARTIQPMPAERQP